MPRDAAPATVYFSIVQKILLLSLVCLPLATLRAESIELQDGTKVEGKILSVTPESVVVEVRPTPGIVEEKTFARTEVKRIKRTSPDDLAFEKLREAGLPNTADKPEVYEKFLESEVRPFLREFAYSKHVPTVRKMAAEAEAEQARVVAGEVKIDGAWVPAGADAARDPEIRARLQLSKMRQATQPGAALVAFEILEKEGRNTSSYPEAVGFARAKLAELQTLVDRQRTDTQRREKEQAQGLELASIDQRLIIQRGIDQERAAVKSRIEATKKTGSKWKDPLPDVAYLNELEKNIKAEQDRLAKIDIDGMTSAVSAAQKAREEIAAGDSAAASGSIEEAARLWPQYVVLASLRESLKNVPPAKNEEPAAGQP